MDARAGSEDDSLDRISDAGRRREVLRRRGHRPACSSLRRWRGVALLAPILLLGACRGGAEVEEPQPVATKAAVSTARPSKTETVPDLRHSTLREAAEALEPLGVVVNWVNLHDPRWVTSPLVVCQQRPHAGERAADAIVVLALAKTCRLGVPNDYQGRTFGETKRLLDRAGISFDPLDGVTTDSSGPSVYADSEWVVCRGSLSESIDDAMEFLYTGDPLWSDNEEEGGTLSVRIWLAPSPRDCAQANQLDPP